MPKRKTQREKSVENPPTVRLKSSRYQPSKAELEEGIRIPTTPERLAKAVLRTVRVGYES